MPEETAQTETPTGAGGKTATDKANTDTARVLGRAVNERWPIGAADRVALIAQLNDIVRNGNRRAKTAAARVLVQMEAQNQTDSQQAEKYGRIDAGKATESSIVTDLRVPPPRALDAPGGD